MPLEPGTNESDFLSPDDPTSEVEDEALLTSEADEAELEEGDDEAGEKPEAEQPEEDEEYELSGKKYRVHKDLKPLLLMQQDYTRKTQEVAEHRKALDQEETRIKAGEESLRQQAQMHQQFIKEVAQIHAIDDRLQQYANVDWRAWREKDFLAANEGFQEMQLLREQRNAVVGGLQQKLAHVKAEEDKRSREAQQDQEIKTAKRREETLLTIQRDIPGWNTELATKVSTHAIEKLGFTRDELLNGATLDPRVMKALHAAWERDEIVSRQKAAAQKAKEQLRPEAAPLTTVQKGRASPVTAGLDDRLSADEWVRRRNEQLRKRA